MKPTTSILAVTSALCVASLLPRTASALPAGNLAAATAELSTDIQNVAWVCGPYRCWWQPNYYYYPGIVVAPRVYYGYPPIVYGYGPRWYGHGSRWYGARWYGRGWYGHRRGRW